MRIARYGGDFGVYQRLKSQLQFKQPVETAETTVTFADGPVRIEANRTDVVLSVRNGQHGQVFWGV